MNGTDTLTAVFACCLLLCVFTACRNKAGQSTENTMIITDAAGRKVKVPRNTEKIVCRGPGTLRLIVYLQAAGRVAAIESGFEIQSSTGRPYMMAHPELARLPHVGAASPSPQLNPEALLEAGPDVIFISYTEPRIADGLQAKTSIPIVMLSYGNLGTFDNEYIFSSLRTAGKILDREKRAEQVIAFIQKCQNDLLSRTEDIPEKDKPSVYTGGLGYKGTHGLTSTEYGYPLFELLHAKSVTRGSGKDGHIFVDKEQIIKWDPDIIFIDEGGLAHVRDDYAKNPEWYSLLKAVRTDRLYGLLPYNFYTTNLGTALADAYYIGKVTFPEQFTDIDPGRKADEIYTFLIGKPVYARMAEEWGGFSRISLSEKN